jgi:hypothetical protein
MTATLTGPCRAAVTCPPQTGLAATFIFPPLSARAGLTFCAAAGITYQLVRSRAARRPFTPAHHQPPAVTPPHPSQPRARDPSRPALATLNPPRSPAHPYPTPAPTSPPPPHHPSPLPSPPASRPFSPRACCLWPCRCWAAPACGRPRPARCAAWWLAWWAAALACGCSTWPSRSSSRRLCPRTAWVSPGTRWREGAARPVLRAEGRERAGRVREEGAGRRRACGVLRCLCGRVSPGRGRGGSWRGVEGQSTLGRASFPASAAALCLPCLHGAAHHGASWGSSLSPWGTSLTRTPPLVPAATQAPCTACRTACRWARGGGALTS